MVEYSRMPVPSLSSGCEIAQFFVRHTGSNHKMMISWWCVCRNHKISKFLQSRVKEGVAPNYGSSVVRGDRTVHRSKIFVWIIKLTPPKRRFWKDEQQMKWGFSKPFSRAWVLNLGHEPLKSSSFENQDFIICSMWETTFARNSHAGLGRPVYEQNTLLSMGESP